MAIFVGERNYFVKRPESFVGDGEIAFATVAAEVAPEIGADGKARLALGGSGFEKRRRGGGHGGRTWGGVRALAMLGTRVTADGAAFRTAFRLNFSSGGIRVQVSSS
jgi:hypothetical protein